MLSYPDENHCVIIDLVKQVFGTVQPSSVRMSKLGAVKRVWYWSCEELLTLMRLNVILKPGRYSLFAEFVLENGRDGHLFRIEVSKPSLRPNFMKEIGVTDEHEVGRHTSRTT